MAFHTRTCLKLADTTAGSDRLRALRLAGMAAGRVTSVARLRTQEALPARDRVAVGADDIVACPAGPHVAGRGTPNTVLGSGIHNRPAAVESIDQLGRNNRFFSFGGPLIAGS